MYNKIYLNYYITLSLFLQYHFIKLYINIIIYIIIYHNLHP